jgi:hypothetical protein
MNALFSIQEKVEKILEKFGLEVHPFKVFLKLYYPIDFKDWR